MQQIRHVSLIGSGNVAQQLGKQLRRCGIVILDVFGRQNSPNLEALSAELEARACTDFADLSAAADLLLIAVSDKAISEVAAALQQHPNTQNILIAHTSGATPMSALAPYSQNYGVFYPLQTFTAGREVDMATVPLCVDANLPESRAALLHLAQQLSQQATIIDDSQRERLHVAAVFVNNFTNHLFFLAQQLCQQQNVPFDLLKPLIAETIAKLALLPPQQAQTGPARRHDRPTIERHEALLTQLPAMLDIYRLLTASIEAAYPSINNN